jgi:hypothetical protein
VCPGGFPHRLDHAVDAARQARAGCSGWAPRPSAKARPSSVRDVAHTSCPRACPSTIAAVATPRWRPGRVSCRRRPGGASASARR